MVSHRRAPPSTPCVAPPVPPSPAARSGRPPTLHSLTPSSIRLGAWAGINTLPCPYRQPKSQICRGADREPAPAFLRVFLNARTRVAPCAAPSPVTSLALSLPRVPSSLSLTPLPLALPLPCISSLARVFNRQRDWDGTGSVCFVPPNVEEGAPEPTRHLLRVRAAAITLYENVEE